MTIGSGSRKLRVELVNGKVMNERKYYLVTVLNYKGERMDLCVTNRMEHARSVALSYADRQAKFFRISDVKALRILTDKPGC